MFHFNERRETLEKVRAEKVAEKARWLGVRRLTTF